MKTFFIIVISVIIFIIILKAFYNCLKNIEDGKRLFDEQPNTIKFINAISSVRMKAYGFEWRIFGGNEVIDEEEEELLKAARNSFGFKNRGSVVSMIVDALDGKIKEEFYKVKNTATGELDKVTKKVAEDESVLRAYELVNANYMSSIAFRLGYLSYDESMKYCLKSCEIIKKNFTSLDELYDKYILGLTFDELRNGTTSNEIKEIEKKYKEAIKDLKVGLGENTNPFLLKWDFLLNKADITKFKKKINVNEEK